MITVIIPIYNSEKYLDKCLLSVKNQTFVDFEVIMVDDGSTDGSADICRKFSSDDSRFKYFYKDNGGVSSAQNLGLMNAKGDYIFFLDSDDYMEPDCLSRLAEHINESNWDIIQCGMNICNGNSVNVLVPPEKEYFGNEFAKAVLSRSYHIFLFLTVCTKLYNKKLFEKSGVRFDENVSLSEDCLFNTQLLPYIDKVKQIDYSGYNYMQDNSTLTKAKITYNKAFQSIRVGNITSGIRAELIKKYNFDENYEVIRGFHTAICIIYISNAHMIETNGFSKKEKVMLYDSYFSVMNYPIDDVITDYQGSDKKIIEASVKKDIKSIELIYKLRNIKNKFRF